jgi:hypothetical protein
MEVPVRDMLTSAPAAAHPGLAPHDLGYETDEIAGVGEKMAMITVIGQHRIVGVV